MYVKKFRGAGRARPRSSPRSSRASSRDGSGCSSPTRVVEIPVEMGRAEPDPDIQELLDASAGPNLGMDFLPGSLPSRSRRGRVDPGSPPTSSGSTPS